MQDRLKKYAKIVQKNKDKTWLAFMKENRSNKFEVIAIFTAIAWTETGIPREANKDLCSYFEEEFKKLG